MQVKYARSDAGVISVTARSHSLTNGKVRATKHHTSETIDWLAARELGAGMTEVSLRLAPTANSQRRRVRMATDYLDI